MTCKIVNGLIVFEDGLTNIHPSYIDCRKEDIESLVIPETVTTINDFCFSGCWNLRHVVIPKNVEVGESIFSHCSSLSSIVFSDTDIKEGTFYECVNLKSVVIPEGVTRVERDAFFNCRSLESIILPKSIRFIDRCAFSGCVNLSTVIMPTCSIYSDSFIGCEKLSNILYY